MDALPPNLCGNSSLFPDHRCLHRPRSSYNSTSGRLQREWLLNPSASFCRAAKTVCSSYIYLTVSYQYRCHVAGERPIQWDPVEVKKHLDNIHFRILVIGRSNAGKTTLLQRVCNTTELPEIYNSKGEKVKYFILLCHRSLMHHHSQLDPTTVQGSLEAS